jgi:hypothetical protein
MLLRVAMTTALVGGLSACSSPKGHEPLATAAPASTTEPPSWSEQLLAFFNTTRGDPYPLDDIPRRVPDEGPLPCVPKDLEVYKGTHLALAPVSIHPAFGPRIERLEQAAREVGMQVYGRPPKRLRHFGGYSCRRSTVRPGRLSEHALGNALDVAGFDFPALPPPPKDAPLAAAWVSEAPVLPPALRGPFQVTVLRHWVSRGGAAADLHQEFLRRLAERVERESIFRVLLGPSHPGHQDHLHFDMSPWTYSHL